MRISKLVFFRWLMCPQGHSRTWSRRRVHETSEDFLEGAFDGSSPQSVGSGGWNHVNPIGSMGRTVHLPTLMVDFYGKCR